MTPNLTELMRRVERDRNATDCALIGHARYGIDAERIASNALIARLLSVIRCEVCKGTGFALDPETNCGYDCPTCGPDRAAIEKHLQALEKKS